MEIWCFILWRSNHNGFHSNHTIFFIFIPVMHHGSSFCTFLPIHFLSFCCCCCLFFPLVNLTGVRWYSIVIFIFLKISNMNVLMSFPVLIFHLCVFFGELLIPLPILNLCWLNVCYWIVTLYLFWILTLYQKYIFMCFLLIHTGLFESASSGCVAFSKFGVVPLIYFSFHCLWYVFDIMFKKSMPNPKPWSSHPPALSF